MTKQEVLEIFHKRKGLIRPDMVRRQLRGFHHRSSVYSYLVRLHKQGLLHRELLYGRIAYRITQRGIERLHFLRQKQGSLPPVEAASALPIGVTGIK
jgi:DNA-binding PadR family transcriptional regulator